MFINEASKWIENNPWFYPVAISVLVIVFIILDICRRGRIIYDYEKSKYSEDFYLGEIKNRDICFLILNIIFIAIPSIVYLVICAKLSNGIENIKLTNNKYSNYFLFYFFAATLILAIVRKDFLLLLIWMIPTISLGGQTHEAVDDKYTYDVRIDSNGNGRVSEHYSGFSLAIGLIGLLFFTLKLFVIAIYLACSVIANFILSTIIYPIMYSIYIYKDSKMLKKAKAKRYESYDSPIGYDSSTGYNSNTTYGSNYGSNTKSINYNPNDDYSNYNSKDNRYY